MIRDTREQDERSPEGVERQNDNATKTKRRKGLLFLSLFVALLLLLSPLWLRKLDYFKVRRVEVVGARYVIPNSLLDRLAIDSSMNIWESLKPYVERVKAHPQVREASISRKLPGTLILKIVENMPVAFVNSSSGLRPLDRDGRELPIDPSKTSLDLPIIARKDTAVLQLLEGMKTTSPAMFARVSEVRWDERGGLRVLLSGMTVRAAPDCTWERFSEIIAVEQDLAKRGHRAHELDLRYRDQIVARIE
jgi:cell division protein FtsQ